MTASSSASWSRFSSPSNSVKLRHCHRVYRFYLQTALDLLLVSRFALGRPVTVGGKCRPVPVRLLSGAVPLYAPTVELPRKTAYLISELSVGPFCVTHPNPTQYN